MTSLDAGATSRTGLTPSERKKSPPVGPDGAFDRRPYLVGLACFIMGAVALGLLACRRRARTGPRRAPAIRATSLGLIITTIWAAALGQSAVAAVFGIFAAFWVSYFMLVTALIRWSGILAPDVTATLELFLITWLVVVVMLTLATLRLPVSFTAVFVLVALTVLLVLLGTEQASMGRTRRPPGTSARWPPP